MALEAIGEPSSTQSSKIDINEADFDECPFDLLPPEMIEKILFRLSAEDCQESRLVTTQWYQILSRKLCLHFKLTTKSLVKFYQPDLPKLEKLSVDMDQILIRCISKTTRAKAVMAQVSTLRFSTSTKIRETEADFSLTGFDLYKGIYRNCVSRGFYYFLLSCSNIHVLVLDFRNTSDKVMYNLTLSDHRTLYLNHLQTIELCAPFRNDFTSLVISLGRLVTPCLSNLKLEDCGHDDVSDEVSGGIVMVWLVMYLQRHQTSLKRLELVNTLLLVQSAKSIIATDFLSNPTKLQLQELKIQFDDQHFPEDFADNDNLESIWNWSYIYRLLHNQKSIQNLSISTNSPKLLTQVSLLLERNRQSLHSVELHLFGSAITVFDCGKLKPLNGLINLRLSVEGFSNIELLNSYLLPCSLETLYWNASFSDFLAFAKQKVPVMQRKNKYPNLRRIVVRRPPAREYVFLPTFNPSKVLFPMIPRLTSLTKRSCVSRFI